MSWAFEVRARYDELDDQRLSTIITKRDNIKIK